MTLDTINIKAIIINGNYYVKFTLQNYLDFVEGHSLNWLVTVLLRCFVALICTFSLMC